METFRTEFLEDIAKRAEVKAELEQSIISFSLQEEHLAEEARAVTYNSLMAVLENIKINKTSIKRFSLIKSRSITIDKQSIYNYNSTVNTLYERMREKKC